MKVKRLSFYQDLDKTGKISGGKRETFHGEVLFVCFALIKIDNEFQKANKIELDTNEEIKSYCQNI